MKKYIIIVLTALISVTTFAQGDIPVKTDGTKYYLQIYDGETNEKVLYHNSNQADWKTKLRVTDYFTGASNQLWSFEATEMYPGYFSMVSHDEGLTPLHHLMSWNWNAYFADNRDPLSDQEMQYRFVEVSDGYYLLETIEKPAGLYGIDYTPGADAMNVKAEGYVSFSEVKSSDITQENMANRVFKFIEFNPMELFEESIIRGDALYENNPNAPAQAIYDLFYTLEKAREVRVFGTEGEMLAFQTVLDSILNQFNQSLGLLSVISDARGFINASDVDAEVKTSFNGIVDDAEVFLNSDDLDYAEMDSVLTKIEDITELVEAIIVADTFAETLTSLDARLGTGLAVSIDTTKAILDEVENGSVDYSFAISHMAKTQTLITEIISAMDLVAATAEFEEAKAELNLEIEAAISVINASGNAEAELDQALADLKSAMSTFQKALVAGDTPLVLKNADFEADLADWNVDSPTPAAAYPSNKGVGGSRSITCWSGSAYQMEVYQSLSGLPSGLYSISCYADVNFDNSFEMFAESGLNSNTLFIVDDASGIVQRSFEVEVADGTLQFGIRGTGTDNAVPAGNWVVMDEFEIKWKSVLPVENADFENVGSGYNNIPGWDVVASGNVSYFEAKGVEGSNSITCYSGAEYSIEISQTMTGMANGSYAVSAMTKSNKDAGFVVFGESNGESMFVTVPLGTAELVKTKTIVEVSDGSLKFGVRGAGVGNTVPNGWIVFDEVELVRLPDIPVENANFENTSAERNNVPGWDVVATTNAVYFQAKGVDGSQGVVSYSGAAYNVEISHTISSLLNGTYAASIMTTSNVESQFVVFGESNGVATTTGVAQANPDHVKTEVIAEVSDGVLKFGVRGAGVGNTAPAGNWFVMDNAALLLKSVVPTYEVPPPSAEKTFALDIENEEVENEVIYWQFDQYLNIRSSNPIARYSVYSITGALVDSNEASEDVLSIPLQVGVYVVRVFTENGFVDTKKVEIR